MVQEFYGENIKSESSMDNLVDLSPSKFNIYIKFKVIDFNIHLVK